MAPQVRVGVGVFVLDESSRFIVGERKGSIGSGTYALPGGHLEPGESFEECATREVFEETALEIDQLYFLTATNTADMQDPGEKKHYVTIFMVGRVKSGTSAEPKLMEPNKCAGWEWLSWQEMKAIGELQVKARNEGDAIELRLPKRLFEPIISLFKQRPGVQPS